MAKNNNPTGTSGLSANLLPNLYRTPANKKFLQATIDQLFQPGAITKVGGFVGRENAKAATGNDLYVTAADTVRQNYQLEPGLTTQDSFGNVTYFKDYIDYINQINTFGGNTTNHARLNKQEMYSWDPHIDWDKFVNFQNYYWMPFGPEVITIRGQGIAVASTYTVDLVLDGNANNYVFTPNGLTHSPIIKLYRGHTYTFEVNSPGNPFSLKTQRSLGTLNRIPGITAGVESGTITYTVPEDAPNTLYYQSETDVNAGGVFQVYDITDATFLDVTAEILGKKNYTLSNGTALSNGMLLGFAGNVTPDTYATGNYYVEGVGSSIKLVPVSSLEIISPYTISEDIQFDELPFDTGPFDGATGFASKVDYITINKASRDHNPWSRYNRWVHKDVITVSAAYNNVIASLDQTARAIRPIIEFQADLKLFNMGTTAIADVDLIDTYTTDIFSTIEGSTGYNIDGVDLVSGYKILVVADADPLVTNKIFQVETVTINGVNQLHLVEYATPLADQAVIVRRGKLNQSLMYWYDGTTWIKGQQKTNTNQSPLFDVVDADGVSYGDASKYDGTTFKGSSIFTYKVGTVTNDAALGFPLSYKNVSNIGDIVFNFTLATDSFQYKHEHAVTSQSVNVGFLVTQTYGGEIHYVNGWQTCASNTVQAAVRIYNDDKVNNFDIDLFDDVTSLSDLSVRVYVNGIRLDVIDPTDLQHPNWHIVTNVLYKQVVLKKPIQSTDILTIKAFAAQPINSNGYYEVPVNLQNNPMNDNIGDFTLGEVIDHVNSIIDNASGFVGNFPGPSNLRDLGNVTAFGTKFVQHSGPLSLGIYHVTSQQNNIVNAIERSRDDYNSFKRTFMATAETLGVDAEPAVMVDLIMQKVNANKPKTSPYYFSDMVPYGAKVVTSLPVVDPRTTTYPLTASFTLDKLSNKAVGVYLTRNSTTSQLAHGVDYTFDVQGFINVLYSLNADDVITTYEYDTTDGSYVPATPTKLGLWPKFVPALYSDTTLVTSRDMIQCHDGSQVLAYGDYRDAILIELETRIYNNIKVVYDKDIFDIADIIPGYNRDTGYSLAEFNAVLAPSFYTWTGLAGVDFTKQLSFDRGNSFTFDYSMNFAPDGTGVPAYWRGIYRWFLDTDRPHLAPWEMLGFSVAPTWWTTVYGPAPYTSDNLQLWTDLANGIVREPNVPARQLTKYVRPALLNHIPVDDQGNLVSPLISGIVDGIVSQSPDNNFLFGDVSPVESAWRRSSYYPFSVLITSMLLTPARTFGLALDRSRVVRNKAGQLVYSDTQQRIRPSDVVLPSISSSKVRVQTAGIINYVVDYILNFVFSNNTVTYNKYISDLQTLTPKLSYRLGAFTNKDQFKLLLESKSPVSSGSVFVPAEDYTVFLNKSSTVKKLTYSGIIITKLSAGFEIKGYSRTAPYFKYYNYTRSGSTINVGGISASFTTWTLGSRYNLGDIVKYGNDFYSVKSTHTATEFTAAFYSKLPALPVVGGANVQLRTAWDREDAVVAPYGTTFHTVQEVADFITGYSEWLKDQGFVFDEFNTNTSSVNNWDTSAREFLFWSTQNWTTGEEKWTDWTPDQEVAYGTIVKFNGQYYSANFNIPPADYFDDSQYTKLDGLSNVGASVISLSPAAKLVKFTTNMTVVEAVSDAFNSYEICKVDGTPIPPADLDSYRTGNTVSYSATDGTGIYGASFYLVQNEHVVAINNTTIFNDTIYSPSSGYRQERIKIAGYVTSDWYGGLDIPGFVFDQAAIASWQAWQDYKTGDIVYQQGFYYSANAFIPGSAAFDNADWTQMKDRPKSEILPNWTNLASQFTDFYSLESDSFNIGQQSVAQHLIGYQKRQYLENIIQDDVSEFKFFQGMIREKGTQNVLNKLFNPLNADAEESLIFYEEWAMRVGQYGATDLFENIELVLDQGRFKNNPQTLLLSQTSTPNLSTFIVEQTPNDVYLKPAGYDSNPFPLLSDPSSPLRSAGYVDPADAFLIIPHTSDIVGQDITTFSDNVYVWNTFGIPTNPVTGILGHWDVKKFINSDTVITDVTYDGEFLTLVAADPVIFAVADYIGISGNALLNGFYQVVSVANDNVTFTLAATIPAWADPFTSAADLVIGTFFSQRVASINHLDNVTPTTDGELVWSDVDVNNQWTVLEYSPVYTRSELKNSDTNVDHAYTTTMGINAAGTFSAISDASGNVITREKVGLTLPWVVRQVIYVPYLAHHVLGHDVNTYPVDHTQPAAIAFSADGTWMATGLPLVQAASIDTSGTYVKVSNAVSTNSVVSGVVSVYKKDVNNIYSLVDTFVNQHWATDPSDTNYGSALTFANDTLFVGAPGVDKVYTLQYSTTLHATVSYNPIGSSGAVIKVSSTAGIAIGMRVVGTGFTADQYVIGYRTVGGADTTSIGSSDGITLLLSGSPSETPSETLQFVTIGWNYGSTYTGETGFGSQLSTSTDQNTVLMSATAHTHVYTRTGDTSFAPVQSIASSTAAVSSTGTYLAVTVSNSVKVYQLIGSAYVLQTQNGGDGGLAKHNVALGGNFGNRLAFMNDYQTLVVYNQSSSAGNFVVYDRYDTRWIFSEVAATTASTSLGGFVVGSNMVLFTDTINSGLFTTSKKINSITWTVRHKQQPIPDPSKIKQAFLYNKALGTMVKHLDVIDPAQGKIATLANNEIRYKSFYDPATYSDGIDGVTVNANSYWSKPQVGTLWWDLRTAKFVDAYYGDFAYRASLWNTLAVGASIDIYEWVETELLPSDWDSLADTPAGLAEGISGTSLYGDAVFSVRQHYDNISKTFRQTYYYWVKNKNITPNIVSRKISALQVSNLIANPRGQGHVYFSVTSSNAMLLVNAAPLLDDTNVVLSVEYWLTDNIDQNIHSQWKLISNDPIVNIPSNIEQKWFDSLCGTDDSGRQVPDLKLPPKLRYGIENRPRQSMFVNRVEALKEFVESVNATMIKTQVAEKYNIGPLQEYEAIPSAITGLYDIIVDTDGELTFTRASSFSQPVIQPVVSASGKVTGIEVVSAGRGYVNAPTIIVHGDGVGAELKATINATGQITGATVISSGEGYAASTTSCMIRSYSALVKSDSQANGNWSVYAYDLSTATWSRTLTQSFDVRNYWNYADWYATGVSQFSAPDHAVSTFGDLNNVPTVVGELVKVLNSATSGWLLLQKYADSTSIDWTQSFTVVGIQNGTIQLSTSLYDFVDTAVGYDSSTYDGNVYDLFAASELKIILDTIKNNIFISDLKQSYLDLFLASVRYAHSEQVYIDWAFKTSFIRATHVVGDLGQPVVYPVDNLANFEDYIAEVKPYRSQIREYISNYTKTDIGQTAVSDFDLEPVYENGKIVVVDSYLKDGQISVLDPVIQSYPWKYWLDNVGFTITELRLVNGGSGYISQPTVTIDSVSGTGATATAYIANGVVNRLILVTPGKGFLTAPTITFTGGLTTGGVAARAIAVIGDSVVRSNLIKMKFDRLTQTYFITDINQTETLSGVKSRLQFPLQWAPDVRIGQSSVTVDGVPVLRDAYTLKIVKSTKLGFTSYSGSITFDTAPSAGSTIVVNYVKDISLLNAADRIQYFYNPGTNQLGNSLSQLMTGIDYGGVQVTGLGFDISGGWDKRPYGAEAWDVYDNTFTDFIEVVARHTHTFTLPYTPDAGVQMNFYYIVGNADPIRLDDPHYGTAQQTNTNAIMLPVIASGSTNVFSIPSGFDAGSSFTIIIRQSTSDGSIKPQESDYDTVITGGDLAYSTATGLNPEDIILDGDGFVTPTSSPAPEEVVPGQVVDAVAIKVFDRPSTTAASVKVATYRADGTRLDYPLANLPNSKQSVIVKVDATILTRDEDYTVDFVNSLVTLMVAPTDGQVVAVFSIGFSGKDVLDIDYFVGDGRTTEFISHAAYLTSFNTLVYLDGVVVSPTIFKTDSTYDLANVVGFRFDTAPAMGQMVNFIVVAGEQQSYAITKSEMVATDGSFTYQLQFPVGNSLPNESNMIVRVDQTILKAPNNSYFTVGGNRLTYTVDATKVIPNSTDVADIIVIADNTKLTLGIDYTVDLGGVSVKINKTIYKKYTGKQLTVSVTTGAGYSYDATNQSITFAQSYDNTHVVEVISSYVHDTLGIQRTDYNVSTTLDIGPDNIEYYQYNAISSGKILLDRTVIDDNYVWVIKNGTLLVPTIDYSLREDRKSIRLSYQPESTDIITAMTFGSNVFPVGIAYMQFKDMLNRTHFKRLNANKQTRLLRDLTYSDTKIEVEDASAFDKPNVAAGRPGIIEIRGERIEYFELSGNFLGKLRRGTLGTGTPFRHRAGAFVTEIGSSENIPYADSMVLEQVVSDGTNTVGLTKITPGGFDTTWAQWNTDGSNTLVNMTSANSAAHAKDAVEVFVGGYNDTTVWAPGVAYSVDKIVQVGSYTYRCVVAHTSASTFTADIANWVFFVGNIRLKKDPYTVFNVNVAPFSPEGDVDMPADFTVDNTTAQVTLEYTLSVGTQVTVAKRVGTEWDGKINIQDDDNKIARFLKSEPGTWYTDALQKSVSGVPNAFDSTIATFDSDSNTFDRGN